MIEQIRGTGAELLVHAIKNLGIKRAFGLCADQTNPLFVGLAEVGIDVIGTRQESAAIHMADGTTRASGEPALAIVGGGPGHVNSVTGVAVAQSAASPVLIISGQPPLDQRERNGHQILYQADLMHTITKWSQEVTNPNLLAEFAARAIRIATSGKPGPVNLSVPINVLDGKVAPAAENGPSSYRVKPVQNRIDNLTATAGDGIEQAAALLASAERPMMLIGGGAWWEATSKELTSLVQRIGIPVFTMDQARGLVADDGQVCFGYAHPSFSRTFRELSSADVIVLVGTEVYLHTGAPRKKLFSPEAKIVQLHRDPEQIGIVRAADAAVIGPLLPALERLAAAKERNDWNRDAQDTWLRHVRAKYQEHRDEWQQLLAQANQNAAVIHPMHVCYSLERHRTSRTRIVIDGGDFVHWPRLFFPATSPGCWMDGAELGVLGASLPIGIGAQIGVPADQTWIFIGDGGFGFYGWELATAVQEKVPVKVIVGNDSCWGVEHRLQTKLYQRTVGVDLIDIRYDRFAEVVGAKGFRADDPDKLDQVIDAFIAADGPCLLDVRIPKALGRPLMN